jgi:hypothetical protein
MSHMSNRYAHEVSACVTRIVDCTHHPLHDAQSRKQACTYTCVCVCVYVCVFVCMCDASCRPHSPMWQLMLVMIRPSASGGTRTSTPSHTSFNFSPMSAQLRRMRSGAPIPVYQTCVCACVRELVCMNVYVHMCVYVCVCACVCVWRR